MKAPGHRFLVLLEQLENEAIILRLLNASSENPGENCSRSSRISSNPGPSESVAGMISLPAAMSL